MGKLKIVGLSAASLGLTSIVTWAFIGFINWDWNPAGWDTSTRALGVMFALVGSGVGTIFAYEWDL